MTRSRELYHRVRYQRRRELCGFIHAFKKYMGRELHLHVTEVLEDCDEDYIMVDEIAPDVVTDEVVGNVYAMCDKYGIPRRNITIDGWETPYDEDVESSIQIYLYSDM